ncbi:MAG: G5 domain-containing protein, partial [Anaerolineae bacterium]|nr:G5 domain-containing protein [Anaerolineae bacterium]
GETMRLQTMGTIRTGVWMTLVLVFLCACRPTPTEQQIRVTVIADGRERTFIITSPTTVEEFLRNPKVDIQLGELDRINPQPFTQITDGIEIRIARVSEQNECVQSEIPFKQTTALNEGLQPGEQRVVQAGQNGILEICYRVTIVDGTPTDRVEVGRTEIRAAQDEIIYTGPQEVLNLFQSRGLSLTSAMETSG